jgi:YidC/Oxa1 family membrane protein insertase
MEPKRLILGMAVTLALLGAWYGILHYVNKIHPEYATEMSELQKKVAEPPATGPATPSQQNPSTAPAAGTTMPSMSADTTGLHFAQPPAGPSVAIIGSGNEKDPTYAMQVILSAHSAGIEKVTLNQFHQSVRGPELYSFEEAYPDHPETDPLAARTLTIDGSTIDTSDGWKLQSTDVSTATFTEDLAIGEHPVARLTKSYRLPDIQSTKTQSQGFELQVDYAIQNLTDHAISVKTEINGPTVPPKEVERGTDRQVLLGFKNGDYVKVAQHPIEEFRKDKASENFNEGNDQTALWAGAASVYFEALVLPDTSAAAAKTSYTIKADNLQPDDSVPSSVAMTFDTGDISIPVAGKASLPMSVFFGPKERKLLETPYYSSFPRDYAATLVIASGFCGVCTFPWLISVLVGMLTFFHWIFRDWGIAIICLVVIVRVLLHPITKKSQVHMMRMGKMGPEMERLKKKYGDDKDALNKAMMSFYKEQGMGPVLGCLPMFLQMPIWIALWSALQSTFELRHSPFLFFGPVHLTWIRDLANPDALIRFAPIHVFSFDISSLNVLPLLLSVVFFFQQKFTPKPITTTPEQAQQQKMMMWMSTLMFPIFLYKGPAGLNLYILTSTTIGIIESKIIRDHIKQREEAEKAGRVFIDTKPTRGAKRRDEKDEPPKNKTNGLIARFMTWLAELQQRAEDIRRQADKGK